MTLVKDTALRAGNIIEPAEYDDSQKLPTRRQLAKLTEKFDDMPTYEVLRRLYKRHAVGIWQIIWGLTVVIVLWASIA